MLQSTVQNITIQGSLGGGIGRFLKNTDQARISLLAGVVWQATDYANTTVPLRTQSVGAGLLVADLSVFKFKKTNLRATASLFPAFTQPSSGRIYFDTKRVLFREVLQKLSLELLFLRKLGQPAPGPLCWQ